MFDQKSDITHKVIIYPHSFLKCTMPELQPFKKTINAIQYCLIVLGHICIGFFAWLIIGEFYQKVKSLLTNSYIS